MNQKTNVLYKLFTRSYDIEHRNVVSDKKELDMIYSEQEESIAFVLEGKFVALKELAIVKAYRFYKEVLIISNLGFKVGNFKELILESLKN
jgi:hypothetical protein